MASQRRLIGVLDRPGQDRDALAEAIAKGPFAVAAAERLEDLPEETALVVAHVRVVPSHQWTTLASTLPTLVVSESRLDSDLLAAVAAGTVDYIVRPLKHAELLRLMIAKVLENHELAREHARDRQRLAELNESLETHLALLRLDQQAGGHIQRKLLPPRPLTVNGVACEYWLAPSLYLSGDFLDFQRFDERYSVFYFADVSGHGASSAFVTVLLKYLCNRWLTEWDGSDPEALPAHWLDALNRELLDTGIGKHATLFVGVIDREAHRLYYSLGAQLPMPLLEAHGEIHPLEGEGMPVGLFPQVAYPSLVCELPANFRLWLCSDGVLECLKGETLAVRLKELERLALTCDSVGGLRRRLALGEIGADDDGLVQDAPGHDDLPDDLTIMTLSGFDHDNA